MKINVLAALLDTGRMASVDFVTEKGKPRTINGRTRVSKFAKNKNVSAVDLKNGNLRVWETLRPQDTKREGRKRYKTIKASRVTAIRADGVEIKVTK